VLQNGIDFSTKFALQKAVLSLCMGFWIIFPSTNFEVSLVSGSFKSSAKVKGFHFGGDRHSEFSSRVF
jgi:hypothetical protein